MQTRKPSTDTLFSTMPPYIIAHRGASLIAPENTLASINLAWEMGSDAVEIDIRLTKDGEIVAMHDATTARTTGVSAAVAEASLEELKRLNAGFLKGDRWAGEPVPTLREILATVPAGRKIVIEIKVGEEILVPLKKAIDASGLAPEQIYLIMFNYELARQCKALFGGCRVLWLTNGYHESPEGEWEALTRSLIEETRRGGFDGINIGAALATESLCACLRQFEAAKIDLFVWTINDHATARQLFDLSLRGITTDVPDFLLAVRE